MRSRLCVSGDRRGTLAGWLGIVFTWTGWVSLALAQTGASGSSRAMQLPLSARQPAGTVVQQTVTIPPGASTTVQVQTQGAYSGSVPGSDSPIGQITMSLAEAVQRGLRTNLGLVGAGNRVLQTEAQKNVARSALLPNLNVSVSESAAKVNLAAEGFSANAFGATGAFQFPTTVGPFHYYDLHGALQQSLLDVTAIRNLRAQGAALNAERQQSRQAREEVVLAVTGVYLQLTADIALLDRQRAEVTYAQASYGQAQAQADAGNKAPLEAARSLVELQTEQQRLRAQVGQVEKRQIQLARLIGLSITARVDPTNRLTHVSNSLPVLDEVIQRAWSQRADLRAAESQLRAAEEARKAAGAQRLPSVTVGGTFGLQGVNPNRGAGVYQAQAAIAVPVFQGGRIEADIRQADAVVAERRAELADGRGSVEADVRNAYIDLQVANDQVALAANNLDLATQTLRQSQDRFSVGVADSVEVVNSQQALAAADHDYVNSLFAQRVATITLAHAMGEAEKDLPELFEGEGK